MNERARETEALFCLREETRPERRARLPLRLPPRGERETYRDPAHTHPARVLRTATLSYVFLSEAPLSPSRPRAEIPKADLPEFYVSKRVTVSTTRRRRLLHVALIPVSRPRRLPVVEASRERVYLTRAESFLARARLFVRISPRRDRAERCIYMHTFDSADVRSPTRHSLLRFFTEITFARLPRSFSSLYRRAIDATSARRAVPRTPSNHNPRRRGGLNKSLFR